MALYRPSELIDFLKSIGAAPKKTLSQNFLIDGNIVRKLIEAGDVHESDYVLEIGAGPGVLTEALLEKRPQLVAVETDRTLAKELVRLDPEGFHLKIIENDALIVPLDTIYSFFPQLEKKIKLFGNLPYHITTPLIQRFLNSTRIDRMIIMVQDEVARRMSAMPGTAAYGSLTVFLSFYAKVKYFSKVSRNCFYPIPNVDSAIVVLDLLPPRKGIDEPLFFKMTRKAFEQRRKTLRKSLKEVFPTIEMALQEENFNPLTRPEELSLDQWIALYYRLNAK